jgi:hypothetical protein
MAQRKGVKLYVLIDDAQECLHGNEEILKALSHAIKSGDAEVRNVTNPDDPEAAELAARVVMQGGGSIPGIVVVGSDGKPILAISTKDLGIDVDTESCTRTVKEKLVGPE